MTRAIDAIVLHTAGAYDAKARCVVHQSRAVIDRYHREHNGWRMIGYHWYVPVDGVGEQGRNDDDVGAHVGGFNSNSLGLCCSGHGDFEPWAPAQWAEALRKCAQWCMLYRIPVDRVVGHRETPELGAPAVAKTCPGVLVDLDRFRSELRARLEGGG